MKVEDLIKKLQKFDPELSIVVDGYEGGVTEKVIVKETFSELNVNDKWYLGEHEPQTKLGVNVEKFINISRFDAYEK